MPRSKVKQLSIVEEISEVSVTEVVVEKTDKEKAIERWKEGVDFLHRHIRTWEDARPEDDIVIRVNDEVMRQFYLLRTVMKRLIPVAPIRDGKDFTCPICNNRVGHTDYDGSGYHIEEDCDEPAWKANACDECLQWIEWKGINLYDVDR